MNVCIRELKVFVFFEDLIKGVPIQVVDVQRRGGADGQDGTVTGADFERFTLTTGSQITKVGIVIVIT